jgi:hypothetical protein
VIHHQPLIRIPRFCQPWPGLYGSGEFFVTRQAIIDSIGYPEYGHHAEIRTIAGAVFVLARQSLVDLKTVAIALGAFALTWLGWKIPEPLIVLVAACMGLLLRR